MTERLAFEVGAPRGAAVSRLANALAAIGIDTPALDARILAATAFGSDAAGLLLSTGKPLTPAEAGRLTELGHRRLAREPVARILGAREFWGLPFRLSAGTLEPRPDTETVVEAALAAVPDRASKLFVVDLGTGSGCILVALLCELPRATGLGVDRSLDALRTARANADASGVGIRALLAASDWGGAVGARADLVVANPPYIPSADLPVLAPEVVRHDPAAALDGGPDGLTAHRSILSDLPRLLAPQGRAVIEIGHDQAEPLRELARELGLTLDRVARDLGGRDRVVVLTSAR